MQKTTFSSLQNNLKKSVSSASHNHTACAWCVWKIKSIDVLLKYMVHLKKMFVWSLSLYNTTELKVSFFYAKSQTYEYAISMEKDFREDVGIMCNLSQKIKETGIEMGKREMIMKMYNKGYTAAQIADVAEMDEEQIKDIIKGSELLTV